MWHSRIHWFEWHDLSAFPSWLRDDVTRWLAIIYNTDSPFPFVLSPKKIIQEIMFQEAKEHIIDLCSGSGGPLPALIAAGVKKITLTDLYPNVTAWDSLKKKYNRDTHQVNYIDQSVNAFEFNSNSIGKGCRTFFGSFHHFRPNEVEKIIKNTMENGDAILIIEPGERTFWCILFWILFGYPFVLVTTLAYLRPLTSRALFFTYIIPLIPLTVWIDGIVSLLRMYSEHELQNIIERIPDYRNYQWTFMRYPLLWPPVLVLTKCVGVRRTAQKAK